ncbi:oligopeptidase A [Actinobacillus equuli]|nr:oligopeptidase A [Actinobacillus equuli]
MSARLSELSSQFSNNVLDATMGWDIVITDEAQLQGLPESALEAAKLSAESKGKKVTALL